MKLTSPNRSHWLMFLIISIVGVTSTFWGEKIPVGNGFGWDGIFYGKLAKNFDVRVLSTYRMQRILPSAVIHFVFQWLQIPLRDEYIIAGFGLYNLLLLLLSCYTWTRVANELNLSLRARWLGFSGLFVNFANLKFAFYYPVLTDVTAFALGLLLLLSFLRNSTLGLCLVTLAGAFTWPVLIYYGLLLLLFPRTPVNTRPGKKSWLSIAAASLLTGFVATLIIYQYVFKGMLPDTAGIAPVVESVAFLSITASQLYTFLATKHLFDGISLSGAAGTIRAVTPARLTLGLLVLFIAKAPISVFADASRPTHTVKQTVFMIAFLSITRPLVFVVAHVLYFGPIFFILVFSWKSFCRTVQQYGLGLVLVMALSVFISLTPESRQSMAALPLAVPLLAKVTDGLARRTSFYWLIGITSLLFSQVWLRINVAPMQGTEYLKFPLQSYFMHQGPWMSNLMYVIQGGVVLLAGLLFYWAFRRNSNPDSCLESEGP